MRRYRCLAVMFCLPLLANPVTAQFGGADPATCQYEACALRLSTSVFHGVGVRRGLNGPVDPMGFTGSGLVRAVSVVPEALREAEAGRSETLRGGVASIIGTLGSISLGLIANREANSRSLRRNLWIGSAAAAGLAFYGGIQVSRGEEHFSRAIWLYNRELPK